MSKGKKLAQEKNLLIALILLVVGLGIFARGFFSPYNLATILNNFAILGFMALGMSIILIMGEIDLSVGSLLAASSCVYTYCALSLGMGVYAALVPGLAVGVISGLLIAFFRNRYSIPSFITSLGLFMTWRGVALVLTKSRTISGFSPSFSRLGTTVFFGFLPLPLVLLLVCALLIWFMMTKTVYGIYFTSIGSNERLAKLSGIPVRRMRYVGFILLGLLSSFSSIIVTSNLMSATPMVGEGFELLVIAGVILGGTSLSGGSGTLFGALMGVLFLQVIESGLALLGIDPFMLIFLRGVIILLAVFANTVQQYGIRGISKKTVAISQE